MKNSSSKRSGSASFKLKPTMVMAGQATVGAFWALAATGSVYAQAAPAPSAAASATTSAAAPSDTSPGAEAPPVGGKAPPGAQQVTVTGIRRGIEAAISVKKNSDQIVEAISAEDIGKLPDTTIAESLARLPGVTTQRNAKGEATNISIRGLGPDFNGYLLNGREQTSTGDSRAVDLSVYPAELIAGATVYKSGDAGLMTAGLAGTIDNKLIEPLAFPNRVISVIGEKTKTSVELPDPGHGHRYALSYIDQFADRKIGVALGWVHANGTSENLGVSSWSGNVTAHLADGTTEAAHLPFGGGLGFETDKITDDRNGLAAILEFKPNSQFTSEVDVYHARIRTYTKKNILTGGMPADVFDATVDTTGQVTAGTYHLGANPNGIIDRAEGVFDDDTLQSFGWKNTLNLTDTWRASLDLNHNSARRVERDIEVYAGNPNADTLSFTLPSGGITPHLTFGAPTDYTDPSVIVVRDQTGWSGISGVPQAGYDKGPTTIDKIDAARVDFSHDLPAGSMFSSLEFGGNLSKRTKNRTATEALVVPDSSDPEHGIPFPSGAYVVNNVGNTGANLLTFDPQADLWAGAKLENKYNNDILSKTWNVGEQVSTAYGKLDIDTALANIPLRGNVGLQAVHTYQYSDGFKANASSDVTLNNPAGGLSRNGTSYNDWLPSLNLAGDLGNGNTLRFAAGIQIARPDLTDMRNSFTVGGDNTNNQVSASAGNPYLKPFKAKALDLSYEKYFSTRGYLSAAVFFKRLDTYIVPQTTITDLQADAASVGFTTLPTNPDGSQKYPNGWVGPYTTNVNGSGGNLHGIELTASIPFNLMTRWLEGFGATASYSYTDSNVHLPNVLGQNPTQAVSVAGNIPLPGLSKINDKAELYYERGGFSSFVAINRRSDYIGSVDDTTIGGYPSLIHIRAQSWLSAQIGYEVQDGWLKGLGLRVEGNNLNRPTYRELNYDGTTHKQNQTGATIDFRLSYKL